MAARKPTFFIVGAPKCGTTSLAAWLGDHPEVCVSDPKEPHFFYPYDKRTLATFGDYECCFADAQPHHKAIGEASTNTVYSIQAIQEILKYQPQAKFIICLRNPVDMVLSLHNHYFFSGQQPIESLKEAWDSEIEIFPARHHRSYRSSEFYRYACALGTHYSNIREALPEGRLLALVLDDMMMHESQQLRRVTDFLEISPSSLPYANKNVARRSKSAWLKQVPRSFSWLKQKLGIRRSLGLGGYINSVNTVHGAGTAEMMPQTRVIIAEHFAPEIKILERLLDADLSHWQAPPPSEPGPSANA